MFIRCMRNNFPSLGDLGKRSKFVESWKIRKTGGIPSSFQGRRIEKRRKPFESKFPRSNPKKQRKFLQIENFLKIRNKSAYFLPGLLSLMWENKTRKYCFFFQLFSNFFFCFLELCNLEKFLIFSLQWWAKKKIAAYTISANWKK